MFITEFGQWSGDDIFVYIGMQFKQENNLFLL